MRMIKSIRYVVKQFVPYGLMKCYLKDRYAIRPHELPYKGRLSWLIRSVESLLPYGLVCAAWELGKKTCALRGGRVSWVDWLQPASVTPRTTVEDVRAMVFKSKARVERRTERVAIFASYSSDNTIASYVVYYLRALRKLTDAIVFVADNPLSENELQKIMPYVYFVKAERHGEHDFGSYKRGLVEFFRLGLDKGCRNLIVCNDSVYGPIFPLSSIFSEMEQRKVDFWGMVSCGDERFHVQSWFYSFTEKVFRSRPFLTFFASVEKKPDFMSIVRAYEHGLTKCLEENGFSWSAYCAPPLPEIVCRQMENGNGNPMVIPLPMIKELKFPFVKVKAFNGGFGEFLRSEPLEMFKYIESVNPTLAVLIMDNVPRHMLGGKDQSVEDLIRQASVVSFDVFDTLLVRPYACPTDLFRHLEMILGCPGFAMARVSAESLARKKHTESPDITIEQIYECIPMQYKGMMKSELQLEWQTLRAHHANLAFYKLAKELKKRIIITSDVYLNSSFLADVLRKNGYEGFERVYASCEHGKTKWNGVVFDSVVSDLGVPANEILHIGDSQASDYVAPMTRGLMAVRVERVIDRYFSFCGFRRFGAFFNDTLSLEASVISEMLAVRAAKMENRCASYWRELGYMLAGPLVVGYVARIIQEASSGVDSIAFVMRDGYILERVYKRMSAHPLPTTCVYTPRDAGICATLNVSDSVYLRKVLKTAVKEIPELRYANVFENEIQEYEFQKELFAKNKDKLIAWSKSYKEKYMKYLNAIKVSGARILTVDGVTGAFSSLVLLQTCLGNRIAKGLFLASFKKRDDLPYSTYKKEILDPLKDERYIVLSELFLTAPTPPCVEMKDGKPVFAVDSECNQKRIEVFREVEQGIDDFVGDYVAWFPDYRIRPSFSCETVLSLFGHFIDDMTVLDKSFFGQVHYATDNTHFVPLLSLLKK